MDMEKEYNILDRDIINNSLLNMGFSKDFTNTIMSCITIVTFSILLNGYPKDSFTFTKGIRQGDLIPYIFIICVYILYNLIINSQQKNLKWIFIASKAPCWTMFCKTFKKWSKLKMTIMVCCW